MVTNEAILANSTNACTPLWCVTKLAGYIHAASWQNLPHLHILDVASSLKLDMEHCSKSEMLHAAHGNAPFDIIEEGTDVAKAVNTRCLACFESCIDRSVEVEVQCPGVIVLFSMPKVDPGMRFKHLQVAKWMQRMLPALWVGEQLRSLETLNLGCIGMANYDASREVRSNVQRWLNYATSALHIPVSFHVSTRQRFIDTCRYVACGS